MEPVSVVVLGEGCQATRLSKSLEPFKLGYIIHILFNMQIMASTYVQVVEWQPVVAFLERESVLVLYFVVVTGAGNGECFTTES